MLTLIMFSSIKFKKVNPFAFWPCLIIIISTSKCNSGSTLAQV